MKRLVIALFASAGALLAPSAQATPPDIATAGDQPFAATPDRVFVLRSTSDNLGQYTGSQGETFLVAIDVATGEETYWLVYREKQTVVYDNDTAEGRVETELLARDDWHDPYAIVADAGATLAPFATRGEALEFASSADGERYTVTYEDGPTFAFSRADAFAQMDRSLAALAERVEDFERMAPMSTRDLYRDPWIDRESCSFSNLGWSVGPEGSFQLIRIKCDDDEGLGIVSLIQVIAPE